MTIERIPIEGEGGTMTEPIAVEDLGWKLVALERDCSRTDLQANISDAEALQSGKQQVVGYHILSCDCQGTGRVPLLPGVRVGCPGRLWWHRRPGDRYDTHHGHGAECCRNLGYRPSTDLAAWVAIPYTVRFEGNSCIVRIYPTSLDHVGYGDSRMEALQAALWKAVGERHRQYRVS